MMIFLFAGIEDKMVVRLMCNEPVRRAVGRRELYEKHSMPLDKTCALPYTAAPQVKGTNI